MTWFIWHDGRRTALAEGLQVSVGRDPDCDVTVSGAKVSRRHLTIVVNGSSWTATDVSSNGTFVAGEPVKTLTGHSAVAFRLGSPDGPAAVLTDNPHRPDAIDVPRFVRADHVAATDHGHHSGESSSGMLRLDVQQRIGRAPDNDLVLDDLLVSAHHAHLVPTAEGTQLVDLSSSRGSFVNGQRVKSTLLAEGDIVSIGRTRFRFAGSHLVREPDTSGVRLTASHVGVRVGDTDLLHDVSIDLAPRSLLGIIGASGSGKSTLLGALTGQRPATRGTVTVDGADLYDHYPELRQRIGFVPQSDLLHTQLPVQQALEYGARLRFPPDTHRDQRRDRVVQVMDELGLAQRADIRIDRLSGGQRKRTSVALELLTKPSLLFLDEPTSGLDPGLDLQVMMLLRELADRGQTVVVVTHAVTNLELCDQVLILAAGGYVAYYGPPKDAPAYFGVADYPQIFMALERTPGREWQQRWTQRSSSTAVASPPSGHLAVQPTPPATQSLASQTWTLTSRYLRVIASDRPYTIFLVAMPMILACLGFVVGDRWGLSFAEPTPDNPLGLNAQARSLLLVLVLGAAFAGSATSIQEVVKERTIYLRERSVGVSRRAYMLSKALVLGVIAALQGAIFALLSLAGRPGPEKALVMGNGVVEIAAIVSLLAVASAAVGLLASAILPSRETALPVLVIITMVQVVLSGAVPVRFPDALDLVGWITPAFWGFNAMAATTDLNSLLGMTPPEDAWTSSFANWWLDVSVLAACIPVALVLATFALGRWDPTRRS